MLTKKNESALAERGHRRRRRVGQAPAGSRRRSECQRRPRLFGADVRRRLGGDAGGYREDASGEGRRPELHAGKDETARCWRLSAAIPRSRACSASAEERKQGGVAPLPAARRGRAVHSGSRAEGAGAAAKRRATTSSASPAATRAIRRICRRPPLAIARDRGFRRPKISRSSPKTMNGETPERIMDLVAAGCQQHRLGNVRPRHEPQARATSTPTRPCTHEGDADAGRLLEDPMAAGRR